MDIIVNKTSVGMPKAPETRPVQESVPASGISPPAEGVSAGRPPVDHQAIQELAAKIQERMNDRSISLSFSTYGRKNDKMSVTVSDKETGEIIREIPPKELQRLSGKIEEMVGMVFDGMI